MSRIEVGHPIDVFTSLGLPCLLHTSIVHTDIEMAIEPRMRDEADIEASFVLTIVHFDADVEYAFLIFSETG